MSSKRLFSVIVLCSCVNNFWNYTEVISHQLNRIKETGLMKKMLKKQVNYIISISIVLLKMCLSLISQNQNCNQGTCPLFRFNLILIMVMIKIVHIIKQ